MEHKDFHREITVHETAEAAFQKIARVGDWWAKKFTGNALQTGDTFRIEFGSTWVNFRIAEAIPEKKTVWHVTDSYLPWLANQEEWTNTRIVFDIIPDGAHTKIAFTHVGLVPEIECYDNCKEGWTRFITISLPRFINEGKGLPE